MAGHQWARAYSFRIFLWNKLDKRFDELKAEMQENRAEVRALREAVLSMLSVKPEILKPSQQPPGTMDNHRHQVVSGRVTP
ncbi:MAG: hypothetical protein TE42_08100 [Candidatus Synechococcus spongiarum SP3]|uniref:Uncharacterized protein n=1 Tax=Candidatus Synechococcus spongiarum SP3 TaxID=1604020 RepID=A0A0G2J4D1_9SYNE|nr:MAG: hypothetical protein TE42_08100 [Candidatus Synechococcus spongiarum SP3]